jgi:hypothetical protein
MVHIYALLYPDSFGKKRYIWCFKAGIWSINDSGGHKFRVYLRHKITVFCACSSAQ